MLSYTFSRREKFLILFLALIVVGLAWFVLVYQSTTNEIAAIESEMTTNETQINQARTRVGEMNSMQAVIDEYKSKGAAPTPVPDYDNMTAVMSELNAVLAGTENYSLAFDEVKTSSQGGYVLRGVRANYNCGSREEAESIIGSLANGPYPCGIDSVALSDSSVGGGRSSGRAPVSATVHITYFERQVN